jgi:SnoaL-like domain
MAANGSALDARLQKMLDHFEIREVLAEYTHGCDRCDEAHMGSVYWPDSWDDHGTIKAPGPEFARLMTERIRADCETLSHLLGQSVIRVDGDSAGAETWFLAASCARDGDGLLTNHLLGGRYVDRLERREGVWKISHRTVVKDWTNSLPAPVDWLAEAGMAIGRRDAGDPSHAVLGLGGGDAANA